MNEVLNPALKPQLRMSACCNAKTNVFPACLGESSFVFCTHCSKECEVVWQPVFKEITKGTYRRIEYTPRELSKLPA